MMHYQLIILQFLAHLLADFITYLFFAHQALHVIILIMVSIAYSNWYEMNFVLNIPLKNAVIITGFPLCSKPANILIKNILTLYSIKIPENLNDNNSDKDLPNAGKLIGIAERFLAFALILAGQYTAGIMTEDKK